MRKIGQFIFFLNHTIWYYDIIIKFLNSGFYENWDSSDLKKFEWGA